MKQMILVSSLVLCHIKDFFTITLTLHKQSISHKAAQLLLDDAYIQHQQDLEATYARHKRAMLCAQNTAA